MWTAPAGKWGSGRRARGGRWLERVLMSFVIWYDDDDGDDDDDDDDYFDSIHNFQDNRREYSIPDLFNKVI